MLKRVLFAIMITLKLITHEAHAEIRDLDGLLRTDITERIGKINEMTIHLNDSLAELKKVQVVLDAAVAAENSTRSTRVFLRNAGAAAAAVGLVGTILYQSKGVNPSKVILAGGYGLTALAGTFSWMKNKAIRFTHEEVVKLQASVKDLEGKIEIEKRNLDREIRLLCLEQGGSPAECDQ